MLGLPSLWSRTLGLLSTPRRKHRKGRQAPRSRGMAFEPLEVRQLLAIDIGNLPFHRVVDNQDAAYSEAGGYWASWSDSSSYGGDFRYHAGGDGSDGAAATWTFDSLDPTKSYQVFVTWSAEGNRASNSPLTVLDGTTALSTALINQLFAPDDATGEGTTWESLGVYQAGSGTLNVRLGDAANGYVIADAVCVAEVPPAATPPSVIDEGDAAYAETGSDWLGWSEEGAYQGDFRYHAPGTGDNAATWTFDGLDPTKRYQVLTTWNPQSNRASNSPFSVWGGAGPLATIRLNQQFAASDVTLDERGWESLGVYTADSGSLVVKLTDDANGDVIADGVRLVEVPPVTTPPSVIDEGDAAYSETGGDWLGWSEQGAYQGDFRYHAPGTGEGRTSWKFSALPVGVYEVYVTWNPQSNRATDSPFTVLDGTNALATTRLNQRLAPSDAVYDAQGWESLGLYSVHSGELIVEAPRTTTSMVSSWPMGCGSRRSPRPSRSRILTPRPRVRPSGLGATRACWPTTLGTCRCRAGVSTSATISSSSPSRPATRDRPRQRSRT